MEEIRFASELDLSRDFEAEKKEKQENEAYCLKSLYNVKRLFKKDKYKDAFISLISVFDFIYVRFGGENTYYNLQHLAILQQMLVETYYQDTNKKQDILDEIDYLIRIFEFD